MEKTYKVLKKFGDLKKGDTFAPVSQNYEGTEADITAAIEAGFIKEVVEKTKKTSVVVTHQGGERTFSQEIHGDDFEDLASEFAETNNGTIQE